MRRAILNFYEHSALHTVARMPYTFGGMSILQLTLGLILHKMNALSSSLRLCSNALDLFRRASEQLFLQRPSFTKRQYYTNIFTELYSFENPLIKPTYREMRHARLTNNQPTSMELLIVIEDDQAADFTGLLIYDTEHTYLASTSLPHQYGNYATHADDQTRDGLQLFNVRRMNISIPIFPFNLPHTCV